MIEYNEYVRIMLPHARYGNRPTTCTCMYACKSEYLITLSMEAKQHYENKVTDIALDLDPYMIEYRWSQ